MISMQLQKVKYMPKELSPGMLYVSEQYAVAAHICPCGCGNKIVTPLGPTEWKFIELDKKATLYPSIGNWQLPCRSHYWIRNGEVQWSYDWTNEQIEEGRAAEEKKRIVYYKSKKTKRNIFHKIKHWFIKD